ncbi:MAG: TIM barrel protein [Clostridiales bacterium]|jgi:deoxyribonuclease-4|nr:TIM barrel protein [Clostridiales bacterium]
MIKFGPAGNSDSFYSEGHKHTVEAPAWLKGRGLDCFEYSLGRGLTIKEETAKNIGEEAKKNGIELSVHAPYFINFANPAAYEKSFDYILSSLKILKAFGGERLVFHVGSSMKAPRDEALKNTANALSRMASEIKSDYPEYKNMRLCPETMGKLGQIGSADERIELCKTDCIYTPCIDFGHINAREHGILKSGDDFRALIAKYADALMERAINMHIHFSRIEYGKGGEVRHLTFEDNKYGPYFEHLAPVIREFELCPYIICESDGTQAEDAAEMKRVFSAQK